MVHCNRFFTAFPSKPQALTRITVATVLLALVTGCGSIKRLFSSDAAAARPAAAQPAAAGVQSAHPLLGSWRWAPAGQGCVETWQYRSDGARLVRAAEQVTQGRYTVTPKPSLLGFYRLEETVTTTNGKADCSGDTPPAAGGTLLSFIQFSPQTDLFIVCQSESLQACFGPFRREI